MSTAKVEAKYPKWREQIIGHSLRAGELNFGDVAALLEDMAGGGYPYTHNEDRVAIRIAIVARAAELLRTGTDLLAMTQRYASECVDCHGEGTFDAEQGFEEACEACADIRKIIAKAVGK